MPENVWRVLAVDDEEDIRRQISEHYAGWEHGEHRLEVETLADFSDAMDALERQRYDLVILDVFQGQAVEGGDAKGREVLNEIKARRFIPVIFYTALPASVEDLQNPLVKVAEKAGAGFLPLDTRIREYLDLPLMRINRELSRHFDETLRDYLWNYVPEHWDEITGTGEDDATLAYLLCRRIAASLDQAGAEKLALRLPSSAGETSMAQGKAHPLRYYIMPAAPEGYRTGDILRKKKEPDSYWIILTPWCDLIEQGGKPPKADHVLLARCLLLNEFDEYTGWTEGPPPGRVRDLIGTPYSRPQNKQEGRYHFLPAALEVADLVVDFQQVHTEPTGDLAGYNKIATLDNPYSESVVSWYMRFLGRVGTPDLDVDKVIANLIARRGQDQAEGAAQPGEESQGSL